MSNVIIPRRKADVQRSYHQGYRRDPMLNVKVSPWPYDWAAKYEHKGHDFSNEPDFWAWFRTLLTPESGNWWETELQQAWDWALESGWDRVREYLNGDTTEDGAEPFPYNNVKVWSAGRSGGWMVVEGLPDVDEWDAIMLGRWRKFAREVDAIVDNLDYDCLWNLHVNFWEPIAEEREAEATDTAAAELPVLMGV